MCAPLETECWRAELRPYDVWVILVNPSEVLTDFYAMESGSFVYGTATTCGSLLMTTNLALSAKNPVFLGGLMTTK
jgi:hypothetical protein